MAIHSTAFAFLHEANTKTGFCIPFVPNHDGSFPGSQDVCASF